MKFLLGRRILRHFLARLIHDDFAFLGVLLRTRKIVPVMDRTYPLSAAADAFRYLEKGRARGKVVLTLDSVANS